MTYRMQVAYELQRGGEWLAAARTWMQSNIIGGDTLKWGSGEPVRVSFYKLEDFAREVAIAAVASERARANGPGTPAGRFAAFLDELEKRYPHPNPYDSTKTYERYFLEWLDQQLDRDTTPQGWTAWTGEGTPPPDDAIVMYKMLDGTMSDELDNRRAGELDWSRSTARPGNDWEIVAYKIIG